MDVYFSLVNRANVFNYAYNYTDHLGNVRLTYGVDPLTGVLKIMEENHHYPFGMKHANYNTGGNAFQKASSDNVVLRGPAAPGPGGTDASISPYKYKYNGMEYQDELGLNLYDYGARNYEPAIGRWMNMDPLAETSRRFSPYTYALDNPVYFIDPDGMEAEAYVDVGYGRMVKPNLAGMAMEFFGIYGVEEDVPAHITTSGGPPDKKKGSYWANKFREIAEKTSKWVDDAFGNDAREMTDTASQWATDYSDAHASLGAGKAWARQMEPVKELYELGFGATGVGISSTKSFASENSIKLLKSVSKSMGKGYESFGEVTATINNTELLTVLNKASKGQWIKVYEAGTQNGQKIEIHYFRNQRTKQVFDVKTKYNFWHQKAFKKIGK